MAGSLSVLVAVAGHRLGQCQQANFRRVFGVLIEDTSLTRSCPKISGELDFRQRAPTNERLWHWLREAELQWGVQRSCRLGNSGQFVLCAQRKTPLTKKLCPESVVKWHKRIGHKQIAKESFRRTRKISCGRCISMCRRTNFATLIHIRYSNSRSARSSKVAAANSSC